MKNVTPAVMWVGGWFDAEDLAGPVKLFQSLERMGATRPDTLGDGPMAAWRLGTRSRGYAGQFELQGQHIRVFQENIELPFFIENLKGKGNGLKATADGSVPKAIVFETGRNQWRRFDAWPPKNSAVRLGSISMRLAKLSWSAPAADRLR